MLTGLLISSLAPCSELSLVTGNNYQPFTDENLENGGVLTEIVEAAFEAQGIEARITFKPWKRAYRDTRVVKHDATFPYVKNEVRELDFAFSNPIVTLDTVFFIMKDNPLDIDSQEQIKNLRVCKPQGYNIDDIEPYVVDRQISLVRPADMTSCFLMMEKNRADVIPINQYVGWDVAKKIWGSDHKNKVRTLKLVLVTFDLHLMVSLQHPNKDYILNAFNSGLKTLEMNKNKSKIFMKHIGVDI